jgi:N-acetylglucosamine-6-phosphate deacetylase
VSEREIEAKYVDLHCHGGAGFYFSDRDPRKIQSAIDFHKNHATSQLSASLVSEKIDDLETQIRRLVPFYNSGAIAGVHLEGPYLARARCGAHNPNLLKSPTISEVQRLIEVGEGAIRMITVAPELENSLEVISYLSRNKIIAAIGHSNGNYDDALKAVDAGAALVTHFSNGMSKLKDGKKTFATALLYETSIPLELIMDGHHVSREDVSVIAEVAGDRIVFVTDAMAAAGQPDGQYSIGDLDVVVTEGVARLKSNSALAGSTLTMQRAVEKAREFDISEDVIRNASIVLPSQLLDRTRQ